MIELCQRIIRSGNIFVPTISNTGTWFLLKFLSCHTKVEGIVECKHIVSGERDIYPNHLVTVHISRLEEAEHKTVPIDDAIEVSKHNVCIIPVRDPMMAAITRMERHPLSDPLSLVRTFSKLPEFNAIFYPVDLDIGLAERICGLCDLLNRSGLSEELYVVGWARGWPAFNSRQSYPLKEHYLNADPAYDTKQ